MNTVEKFVGLVNAAHGNAIAKGWWEQERTLPELVALIHSEASEALEDFRKGHETTDIWYEYEGPNGHIHLLDMPFIIGVDDHKRLGKPCGIPSELADIVIRVFDLVGKFDFVDTFASALNIYLSNDAAHVLHKDKAFGDNMGWLHVTISNILLEDIAEASAEVVYCTYKLAEYSGIDLDAIIEEKMAYNTTRGWKHGGKVL